MECTFMPKKWNVHREEKMRKANIYKKYTELQNTSIHGILFWITTLCGFAKPPTNLLVRLTSVNEIL